MREVQRRWVLQVITCWSLAGLGAACTVSPELRSDLRPEDAYQTVADALPSLSLGVGDPPPIIRMSRSPRLPARPDASALVLRADDRGFTVRINSLIPRTFRLRYEHIEHVDCVFDAFPNAIYCSLFPFLQTWRLRVVVGASGAAPLLSQLAEDIQVLRSMSGEISLPQPYYYAEEIARMIDRCEYDWGLGRLELTMSQTRPIPPFIPIPGRLERFAEAFQFAAARASDQRR